MAEAVASGFEELTRGLYLEGLAVDQKRGLVWVSDVIGGGVRGVGADGAIAHVLNPERMWTGGIVIDEDGLVLSSGAGGIMWNDPASGRSGWLIDTIDGQPINGINEMAPDGSGGLYFGTVDLENVQAGQPARPAAIYRLSAAGNLTLEGDGLGFTNGMARSGDGRRLCCNETFDGTYVYEVREDGALSNRRRLLAKEDADGMAFDAAGNLWVTGYKSGEIVRLRPDGSPLPAVATPAGAITQVRFGGPDLHDVYIACVPVEGGDDLATGVQPTERNSILYRGRSATAGQRPAPVRFDPPIDGPGRLR
jgi:sugar lactone lactonase YvrE